VHDHVNVHVDVHVIVDVVGFSKLVLNSIKPPVVRQSIPNPTPETIAVAIKSTHTRTDADQTALTTRPVMIEFPCLRVLRHFAGEPSMVVGTVRETVADYASSKSTFHR
jgi:hypothetical protein